MSRASPDECVSLRDIEKTTTKKRILRDFSLGSIYSQVLDQNHYKSLVRNHSKKNKLRKNHSNQRIAQPFPKSSNMKRTATHFDKVPRIKGFENLN